MRNNYSEIDLNARLMQILIDRQTDGKQDLYIVYGT